MRVWLRLGWREIVRSPRFTTLFVLNLALGLAGFLLITAFGGSLGRHLDDNLREMLGEVPPPALRPDAEFILT